MEEKDDMEYKLNVENLDENIIPKEGNQWPKPSKIILIIFIIICIALAAALGTFIFLYLNKSSSNSKKNQEQSDPNSKSPTKNETEIIDLFNFFGLKYIMLLFRELNLLII